MLMACGQGNEPVPETDTGQNEPEEETSDEETAMHSVYLFFPDENVEELYRVEREVSSDEMEGAIEALNMWLEGPESDEAELTSLTDTSIELQSVEDHDGIAHVSFSPEFLDIQVGSGTEEMLLQQVALIMDQFGYEQTQILIDGESQEQLFGHIQTDEPITAENDPESYELVES
ncbi:GerMN domain-containing protein [Alkalicoccobacillus porphyridii]|uniref:GerMN domain-containing protein n=2 Tax=Alkalicoccobacillus porphyridii TaxID=2597270 RepID=A0A553ZXW8_9BACI|nr:GerMN domain-containing protein [Alkalicoccobacillus porphyridii]